MRVSLGAAARGESRCCAMVSGVPDTKRRQGLQRRVPAGGRRLQGVRVGHAVPAPAGVAEGGRRADGVPALRNVHGYEDVRVVGVPPVAEPRVRHLSGDVRRGAVRGEGLQPDGQHAVRRLPPAVRRRQLQVHPAEVRRDRHVRRRAGELQELPGGGELHGRRVVPVGHLHGGGEQQQRVRRVHAAAAVPARLLQRRLRRVRGHALHAVQDVRGGRVPQRAGRDGGRDLPQVPRLHGGGQADDGGLLEVREHGVRGRAVRRGDAVRGLDEPRQELLRLPRAALAADVRGVPCESVALCSCECDKRLRPDC